MSLRIYDKRRQRPVRRIMNVLLWFKRLQGNLAIKVTIDLYGDAKTRWIISNSATRIR